MVSKINRLSIYFILLLGVTILCPSIVKADDISSCEHELTSEILQEPTADASGIIKYTCSKCSGYYKLYYQIDNNNDAIIFNGALEAASPTEAYEGTITDVTLPKQIDGHTLYSIGKNAFLSTKISSINFSNTVLEIGDDAFYNCRFLKTLENTQNIQVIGEDAFYECIILSELSFPSTTKVGREAFEGCSKLKTLNLPKITYTSDYMCNCCEALESADISSATTISGSFIGCENLVNIKLSQNIKIVSSRAFYCCYALKSITLKGSCIELDEHSFSECRSLSSVTIIAKEVRFPIISQPDLGYYTYTYLGNKTKEKIPNFTLYGDCADVENYASENGFVYIPLHDLTYVQGEAATCSKTGILDHWHCNFCESDYQDEAATIKLTSTNISKLAHTKEIRNAKSATTEEEGYTGDTYCTVCGTLISKGTTIAKILSPSSGTDSSTNSSSSRTDAETKNTPVSSNIASSSTYTVNTKNATIKSNKFKGKKTTVIFKTAKVKIGKNAFKNFKGNIIISKKLSKTQISKLKKTLKKLGIKSSRIKVK